MSASRTAQPEVMPHGEAHPGDTGRPRAAPVRAAWVAAALYWAVAAFHAALVLGAPWGEYTQGGATSGSLALSGRLVAGASCALSLVMAGAVLGRVRRGPFGSWPARVRTVLAWATTVYAAVSVVLNLITRSTAERTVWAPVCLVLLILVSFVMVAAASPASRRRLRRAALMGVIVVLVSVLAMTGVLWWRSPGTPRPFLDSSGHPLPGSISEKIWVPIDGVQQGMVIRGKDVTNPVLLWVSGGPGMPDYQLTDRYPPHLEDLFTVVWWDQRGAGMSYHSDIPRDSMTVDQFIDDILSVTDYLRHRFGQDKIYLLGHSWGSFIGIQAAARAPEKYQAYLGMGQMVDQLRSEKMAYDYMLNAYRQRGNTAMVRDLEAAPVTMTGGTPDAYLKLRDAAMHGAGVGTTRDMHSVITGIFWPSWWFRGYTIAEKVNLWRGRAFSRSFGLWDQVLHTDLRTVVPRLEIPAYIFQGRYDYTAATPLARDYFEQLRAPVKGFYEFDDSAHSPLLEQPQLAHRILAHDVLDGTTTLSDLH